MVVKRSQPMQVYSLCLERFQDSGRQFLRSFSEPLVNQGDLICSPRGLSCSGALNTTFEDCVVSCSGFFGDVQKEDLRLAQDFDRLEDLTKEYNRWKAKYSKNLVFNASAPYFSECSHYPDNKWQTKIPRSLQRIRISTACADLLWHSHFWWDQQVRLCIIERVSKLHTRF